MAVTRIAKVSNPGAPNIHLGAAGAGLVSVCLTAPDKSEDLAGQTRQVLDTISDLLEQANSSSRRILMVQVWLADIREFADFRDAWNNWIDPDNIPALSVVEAQASRRDSLVEIRAYAAPGSGNEPLVEE